MSKKLEKKIKAFIKFIPKIKKFSVEKSFINRIIIRERVFQLFNR
jgi:hypothetical protein